MVFLCQNSNCGHTQAQKTEWITHSVNLDGNFDMQIGSQNTQWLCGDKQMLGGQSAHGPNSKPLSQREICPNWFAYFFNALILVMAVGNW